MLVLGYIFLSCTAIIFARAEAIPYTNATCLAGFDWSFNAQNQSPCQVAAYLGAVCFLTQEWVVAALTSPGDRYTPPSGQNANPCECSTVFYDVIGLCGLCQNGSPGLWSEWIAGCPPNMISIAKYPYDPPTNIPAWAYYNPTSSNNLNVTAARQLLNPSTTPKSSNTGAIVGGAVGGALGLALIAVLVWWFVRRQNRTGPHQQPVNLYTIGAQPQQSDPRFSQYTGGTQFSPAAPPVQYNPNDPATFPVGSKSVTPLSQSTRTHTTFESTPYQPALPNPARQSSFDQPAKRSSERTPPPPGAGLPRRTPTSPRIRSGSTATSGGPFPRASLGTSTPDLPHYPPGPWNTPRASMAQS
ncbi:hypothetical protein BOTBODRAFT_39372 [Botryobasidium botryosum FD-172 SS1]|uniref:Transmembrane protein n=1 Tax=Botryobasidium botryosum (strain FD-172 SS1) TaxID=930990 RepID=A0A067M5C8_BOTB1|nr:hypothetical protein BOTBODRAFT_39372 [Botryobasidium botryosum FD-172 SS1]